jgi:hypothetical protein
VYHAAVRLLNPRALLALLAVITSAEVLAIASRVEVLVLIAAACWMAWPGVVLARRVFGARDHSGIAAWLVGPALGFGFSVFGAFLLWAARVQGFACLVLGPLLTLVLASVMKRFGAPTVRLPTFDRNDIVAVCIALMVVPLVTWMPYGHVRQPVDGGEAYRAYFTADFVWAMTVTSELAKGDVPPSNPFLDNGNLNYYWMAHFLSGALYRNVSAWGVTAEQVILVNSVFFGLAFVAFMYALIRMAGAAPVFAMLGVLVGFLANSYEGVNRLLVMREAGESYDAVRFLNIDAVTRWFYQGMPVDGLQRLLLYQPHHLTGYVMALAALWLVGFAERVEQLTVAIATGVLLALAFLFSTFTAILVGAAVAILYAWRLLSAGEYRALIVNGIVCGGAALIGVLLTQLLRYTDPHAGTMLVFGWNLVALRQWPFMMFLSFGPLLLLGIAGLLRVAWVLRDGAPAALLILVSFAFYFLIDVPDMGGVWVGWRSGHQLLVAFSVVAAVAFTAWWKSPRLRLPLAVMALLALMPAVPTVAIDVYNAQDTGNREWGPSFPWTLVITSEEREALDWLKRATPPAARVQFDAHFRGSTYWAWLPAFAERRMAAGLPGAMIPVRKFEDATQNVRFGIFMAANAEQAHVMAEFLMIDYIYIGAVERRFYRATTEAMTARPDLFPTVFKNASVTILGVARR